MDIMELGAIGELVGGVAVIASLIYVGLQVRQSNEHAQQSIAMEQGQAGRETPGTFAQLTMTDPEFITVLQRATTQFDGLSHADQGRVAAWLTSLQFFVLSSFIAAEEGLFKRDMADRMLAYFASYMKYPGLNKWWAHLSPYVQAEFVDAVEQQVSQDHLQALHVGIPWFGPSPIEGN